MMRLKRAVRLCRAGKRDLVLFVAAAIFATSGLVQAQSPSAAEKPAAVVEGTPISMEALEQRYQSANAEVIRRLRQQMEDLRRTTLDLMVAELVVKQTAAKRGISEADLLEQASGVAEVSEAEILQTYQSMMGATKPALDLVRPQLRKFLEEQKKAETRRVFVRQLVAEASVSIDSSLEPPRSVISNDPSDPRIGAADAPVQIVEFGDFECAYCLRAAGTLRQVLSRFGGAVSLTWKDYPLRNHRQAELAAEASACAAEGGQFWAFHERLLSVPLKIGPADLRRHAAALGLDSIQFDQCIASGRHKAGIALDVAEAKRLNVTATPTTFVNGLRIEGAVPLDEFVRVIELELRRKAGTPK